jgi:hypothetical protein
MSNRYCPKEKARISETICYNCESYQRVKGEGTAYKCRYFKRTEAKPVISRKDVLRIRDALHAFGAKCWAKAISEADSTNLTVDVDRALLEIWSIIDPGGNDEERTTE